MKKWDIVATQLSHSTSIIGRSYARELKRIRTHSASITLLTTCCNINREVEFLEIKFHVLEWNNIEWYSSYDEDAIKFFNDEGKKVCDEFIRIGEEPDDVDFINGHNLLWIDGDDIHIMGVTLLNHDRKQILKDLAQLLLRADPFAVKGYQEAHKSYECDEFTDLFKFKEVSKS